MGYTINKRIERNELIETGSAPQAPAVASCLNDPEALIGLFLAEQQVMQSSRRTYGWAIRRFFRWCEGQQRSAGSVQRADLVAYIDSLTDTGYSQKTVGLYTVAVRRFFGWLESRRLYPDVTRGLKGGRQLKDSFEKMHLERSERTALLLEAKGRGKRDYAIVNLMLRNGLRTVEVARLDTDDVTTRRGVCVLRLWRKGHSAKDSWTVLTPEARGPIEDYLQSRGTLLAKAPLFVTEGDGNTGRRLTPRRVQQIVRSCLDAIGLTSREYSPHSLRHTTAVAILEAGGSVFDVQTVLGHASPVTSQIYTRSIEEEMRLKNPPEGLLRRAFGEEGEDNGNHNNDIDNH